MSATLHVPGHSTIGSVQIQHHVASGILEGRRHPVITLLRALEKEFHPRTWMSMSARLARVADDIRGIKDMYRSAPGETRQERQDRHAIYALTGGVIAVPALRAASYILGFG